MQNGVSLPAHLPLPSLSDPSRWLQYKWLQPPPRAPNWVFDDFQNSIPRPMLVVPFATRIGSNEHFAKTSRLPACCLQNFPGGQFFLRLAPSRNVPSRIGSARSMPCGRTSATTSRRRPAHAILTSKLLANNRRQFIANASLMIVLPTYTRRPIFAMP
jgi:hypothetical protein